MGFTCGVLQSRNSFGHVNQSINKNVAAGNTDFYHVRPKQDLPKTLKKEKNIMRAINRRKIMGFVLLVAIWTVLVVWQNWARAASHSDAPLIKQDPQANITDVYAFIGTKYNDLSQNVLNVVVQVRPFSEPGDGVIYDRFADDALYSIHIADPNTGETVLRYNYQFSSVTGGTKNQNTILSYGLGIRSTQRSYPGEAPVRYRGGWL